MDNLISRAAAIAELMQMVKAHEHEIFRGELLHYTGIKAMLEAQPAVDAVPVAQGEWVEEPDRVGHYHCSNCGVVWGIAAKAMKYCPNCAAKMTNSPMWDVEDAK